MRNELGLEAPATKMKHIIATDEAGYGPNLGPLVIGATRWRSATDKFDPRAILSEFAFQQKRDLLSYESKSPSPGMMVADSKAVYNSGKIELLERGVLASLFAIHGALPKDVGQLLEWLDVDPSHLQNDSYFSCSTLLLPLATDPSVVATLGQKMAKSLGEQGASLEQLSVALAFPQRFNSEAEAMGNKASFLTKESLSLIAKQITPSRSRAASFDIRCDKHGGRNRYRPAIEKYFGDSSVTIEQESRPKSSYQFLNGKADICFVAKGEDWLPIALSSMVAKYLREIFMQRWNEFWQSHLPDLKPTKGYPLDARRFKADIAKVQQKLKIEDETIWRMR